MGGEVEYWRRIPEEIAVEILSRLPWKSLCQFKCVSKQWYRLISDRRLVIPKATEARIVIYSRAADAGGRQLFYRDHRGYQQALLRLDNQGGSSVDDNGFRRKFLPDTNWMMLDSCNGFVLSCQMPQQPWHRFRYLVHHGDDMCCVEFLYPPRTRTDYYNYAAAITDSTDDDGRSRGRKDFIVVRCHLAHSWCIPFDVYSSKDRIWRQKVLDTPIPSYRARCPRLPTLSLGRNRPPIPSSLFFKSTVHWRLLDHLLICHLKNDFCKLITLPPINVHSANLNRDGDDDDEDDFYRVLSSSHIWGFQGRLHFCQIWDYEINIWALHHVKEQNEYIPGMQYFEWHHKHRSALVPPIPNPLPKYGRDPFCFYPFAFNEDFEMLYLRWENNIISYHPRIRRQKIAHTCSSSSKSHRDHNASTYPSFSYVYATPSHTEGEGEGPPEVLEVLIPSSIFYSLTPLLI